MCRSVFLRDYVGYKQRILVSGSQNDITMRAANNWVAPILPTSRSYLLRPGPVTIGHKTVVFIGLILDQQSFVTQLSIKIPPFPSSQNRAVVKVCSTTTTVIHRKRSYEKRVIKKTQGCYGNRKIHKSYNKGGIVLYKRIVKFVSRVNQVNDFQINSVQISCKLVYLLRHRLINDATTLKFLQCMFPNKLIITSWEVYKNIEEINARFAGQCEFKLKT